jgi:hypothetical protein
VGAGVVGSGAPHGRSSCLIGGQKVKRGREISRGIREE